MAKCVCVNADLRYEEKKKMKKEEKRKGKGVSLASVAILSRHVCSLGNLLEDLFIAFLHTNSGDIPQDYTDQSLYMHNTGSLRA